MFTKLSFWSDYMEKDVYDKYCYEKNLSTQHVKLINRKKEYIVEYQKAKDKGITLKFGQETKKDMW